MIYFIREMPDGNVKIGKSSDPKERLKNMSTSTSRELKLLYVFEPYGSTNENKERELHKMFKKYKIKGEWFFFAKEIEDFINMRKIADKWEEQKEEMRKSGVRVPEMSIINECEGLDGKHVGIIRPVTLETFREELFFAQEHGWVPITQDTYFVVVD